MGIWPWNKQSTSSNENQDSKPPVSSEKLNSKQLSDQLLLEDIPPKFAEKGAATVEVETVPGRPKEDASVSEIVKSVSVHDFMHINEVPCFRKSYLNGFIGGGVAAGVTMLMGSTPFKTFNWFVGTLLAVSTASFEYCRAERRKNLAFQAAVKDELNTLPNGKLKFGLDEKKD